MPGKCTPCTHYTCTICTNSRWCDPRGTTPGHMGMNISPWNNAGHSAHLLTVVGPLLFGSLNVVTKENMIRVPKDQGIGKILAKHRYHILLALIEGMTVQNMTHCYLKCVQHIRSSNMRQPPAVVDGTNIMVLMKSKIKKLKKQSKKKFKCITYLTPQRKSK